jgi:hypothetical protein
MRQILLNFNGNPIHGKRRVTRRRGLRQTKSLSRHLPGEAFRRIPLRQVA